MFSIPFRLSISIIDSVFCFVWKVLKGNLCVDELPKVNNLFYLCYFANSFHTVCSSNGLRIVLNGQNEILSSFRRLNLTTTLS